VGAQKAGTSWWDALITAHPDVYRLADRPKELHFFDHGWEDPFDEREIARYALHFPRPDGGVTGEWTPGYLIDFWTPSLIAQAAPQTRILILLRDPMARFASSLTHQLSVSREALTQRDIQGAFQRGLYAPQLRRVLAAFPRAQVFIGQYEACRSDPAAEIARTYDFLGLAPFEPAPTTLRGEVNPTTGRRFEPARDLRRSLLDGYAPDLEQLPGLVPGIDLSLWPTARELTLA
jgi:hypothetical protein